MIIKSGKGNGRKKPMQMLVDWDESCPNCGISMKYLRSEVAGPQSDKDYYKCPKCRNRVICQIWKDGRFSIYNADTKKKF